MNISATALLSQQQMDLVESDDDWPLPKSRLNRILDAVETIEKSIGILARKQQLSRGEYKTDPETRDVVEFRYRPPDARRPTLRSVLASLRAQPRPSLPRGMAAAL